MLPVVLLLLAELARAEYSVRMPYLNPAGVTYTSYSAAYGPLAYKSLHTPLAAAPLVAATPLAAAHYAVAAAPLTTVHSSAVLPVTRYTAQPAVLQNVVDVAHPKVASRRYQIRRPAIQKEFYDIEERIIVRPAGRAVVELEQPISTRQQGPTQVSPALHVQHPLIKYAGIHKFQYGHPVLPAYVPSGTPVHESNTEYEEVQQQEEVAEQQPQQPYPQQTFPQQQFPQLQFPQQQFPQQQFPQQPQQPFPQQPQQPQQPAAPQQEPQFDDADTISIDNPDLSRSTLQQQSQQSFQNPIFRSQLPSQPQPQPQQQQPEERSQPQVEQPEEQNLQEFERIQAKPISRQPQLQPLTRSQQSQQSELQTRFLERNQIQPQFLRSFSFQPLPLFQSPIQPQFFSRIQQQESPEVSQRSELASRSESRAQTQELVRSEEPTPRPEVSARQGATVGPSQAALRTTLEEIPSARNISPQDAEENQRRLIELLTGQGPVSEVRSAAATSGDTPVRARVLSATPAPRDAPLTDSQTKTRRVVVSKPIQTVQEVEVVEPFTKLERVAVHQPAVLKSAHVELAHVPTVHHAVPALHAAVTPVPLATHYLH